MKATEELALIIQTPSLQVPKYIKLFTPAEFTRTQSKAFWLTSLWKVMRQQQKQYSVVFPCNLWPCLSFRSPDFGVLQGPSSTFRNHLQPSLSHQPKFSLLKSLAKALKLPSERQKKPTSDRSVGTPLGRTLKYTE